MTIAEARTNTTGSAQQRHMAPDRTRLLTLTAREVRPGEWRLGFVAADEIGEYRLASFPQDGAVLTRADAERIVRDEIDVWLAVILEYMEVTGAPAASHPAPSLEAPKEEPTGDPRLRRSTDWRWVRVLGGKAHYANGNTTATGCSRTLKGHLVEIGSPPTTDRACSHCLAAYHREHAR